MLATRALRVDGGGMPVGQTGLLAALATQAGWDPQPSGWGYIRPPQKLKISSLLRFGENAYFRYKNSDCICC
jgi:hypothetical protein